MEEKEQKKKRSILPVIFVILLVVAGLSLLLYPMIANQWNNMRQKQLISSYEKIVDDEEAAGNIDYEAERQKAETYNANLVPSILPDSFAEASAEEEAGVKDSAYYDCLNLTDDQYGTMGYVEIPKINIKLPIFHGTSSEVLDIGAGHLEGSSLPVGGESTHTVISAHRGLPSAALFTDLDKLEVGDHFLIYVLDEVLCYEVDQINVVDPEDTSLLVVEDGKDLATLLTCTPYGVNTQRLLVRGHRVAYDPQEIEDEDTPIGFSAHTSYWVWVVLGLAVVAAFAFFLRTREKQRAKKAAANATDPENTQETDKKTDEESAEEKE